MVINGEGWENHEDTLEEAIRREMLAARQDLWLLKMDYKELKKAHYKVLKRNKELLAELANNKECTCDD